MRRASLFKNGRHSNFACRCYPHIANDPCRRRPMFPQSDSSDRWICAADWSGDYESSACAHSMPLARARLLPAVKLHAALPTLPLALPEHGRVFADATAPHGVAFRFCAHACVSDLFYSSFPNRHLKPSLKLS